ncbi:MAG: Voltage-gated potassium channel [Methanocella sp. PtaU1.Bin125]|nr:MAG: Voltage-gated potassium channel [Methanocella sp. PtaU1.Bin125]
MLPGIKERAYEILSIKDPEDRATRLVNMFLIVLLLINVAAFFLQTFEDIAIQHILAFRYLEMFSVAVFTVEYLLRVWVADLDPMYTGPVTGRLRYMFTDVLAIVDLVAIFPYYLQVYLPGRLPFDLLAIRVLRLFRLARLVKLARYSDSLDTIVRVITKQREFLLITFTIQMILLLVSSAIMFYLEHEAQPEKFPNIFSALAWGLSAMTSGIGYPDVYPITPLGKAAGAILAFIEIVAMALPIGVITAGIEQEMNVVHEKEEREKRDAMRHRYIKAGRHAGPRRSR